MTVFVDTSAIYALLDRDDENHTPAGEAFARLIRDESLLTHNYVVVESAALIQNRLGAAARRQLFDDLLGPFELIWVDERIHRSAAAAMIAAESPKISFVDWTSFEVMRQQSIDQAFAFGENFARQGFRLVA